MASFHEEPEPGHLIEIFHDDHKHWALYVGDAYVIHLAPPASASSISSSSKDSRHDYFSNFSFHTSNATVKRELLKDVAGKSHYQVNNHLDKEHTPQLLYNILSAAHEKIGKEMEHSVHSRSCEHFVNYLRYGIDYNKQFHDEPKLGDLIEIFYIGHVHWALYVGGGYVVHLAPPDAHLPTTSGLFSAESVGVVKREHLKDLVRGCRYRVNNLLDKLHRPRPVRQIADSAMKEIGQKILYNHELCNSEHFVTYLRNGVARSTQAECAQTQFGTIRNIGYSL